MVLWFKIIRNGKRKSNEHKITTGKDSDISVLEKISSFFKGILVGDRGYISFSLLQKLLGKGIELVIGIRANMKNMLMRSH